MLSPLLAIIRIVPGAHDVRVKDDYRSISCCRYTEFTPLDKLLVEFRMNGGAMKG